VHLIFDYPTSLCELPTSLFELRRDKSGLALRASTRQDDPTSQASLCELKQL